MENIEQMEGQQEKVEALFDSAESWEEIDEMIDDLKSEEEAEKLKEKVAAVRDGVVINDVIPFVTMITREGGLRDKVKEFLIKDAKDWGDLKGKLTQIQEIKGMYETELFRLMEQAKTEGPDIITRTHGLRKKVKELMVMEAIH
jgi:hypothetical protein